MTSAAALLPPVPALPHDPSSLVLDGRVGFSMASASTKVEISSADCALALAFAPGGAGALADAAGTFGGNVLPDHVALAPSNKCGPGLGAGGVVLLLDRAQGVLKRFDACACAFVRVPCIGGFGIEPRRVLDPGGIVTTCGNLYLCDAGNARVQVFALRGLPLRAIWTSPGEAKLSVPWRPVTAAADCHGHVYIGDIDNGCVHVFQASGRWLRALVGLGAIEHLAVDRSGRLYVQIEAQDEVLVIDPETWPITGRPLERLTGGDAVAGRFASLPFAVNAEGNLELAPLCAAAGATDATETEFDVHGVALPPTGGTAAIYETSGTFLTTALDSALHRCVWDRLELRGEFPADTMVAPFLYTSDSPIPDALIAALPSDAWSACPVRVGASNAKDQWDCLLRAPEGRYAWIKLVLSGSGHSTARLCGVKLVFPRVSLRRFLPGVFGADTLAAEFTDRLLGVFDRELRSIERTIDDQAHFYDPLSAPENDADRSRDFLSWLASWIGVTLERSWPIERRRRYLKGVGRLLSKRGTLEGLRAHLQLFLGLPTDEAPRPGVRRDGRRDVGASARTCGPCTTTAPPRWRSPTLVLENFRLRRWLFLGHGKLGEEARLWGDSIVQRSRLAGPCIDGNARIGTTRLDTTPDPLRDPFLVYANSFTVFAPAAFARSPGARGGLDRLVRAERPAHTAYRIVWVEPRFRIGIQSMIGFDSAIGCYPDGGVRVQRSQLGRATVLGSGAPDGIIVGKEARIGTTTQLR